MTNNDSCLRVCDLRKRFTDFALGPLSLDVPAGSVVGLIGQNGAGKTTLMKLVLGTLHSDGGRVELFGQDVGQVLDDERVALRSQVGYVASECAYPLSMTVGEVARMHELAYPHFDRGTFDALCNQLGIGGTCRKVGDLSRGMGMKLQLVCMIAANVRLLVLDEPTAGLDPVVRDETLDVLRTWMETDGRAILISSHITSDLENLADYLVMLSEGRVVLSCDHEQISSMGVARLRGSELEQVLNEGMFDTRDLRLISRSLSRELLVPDRLAFVRAYPDFVCDPASIDDVMLFFAKGEEL